MAARLFDKGRNRFARGELKWRATGGDTFRILLADSSLWTPDTAVHEFFSDIAPSSARFANNSGTGGGAARADCPALVLLDPVAGVCDANDSQFTGIVAAVPALEFLVCFMDSGVDGTSPLVFLDDAATGLAIDPAGGTISVTFSDGPNKIFKL